MLAWSGSFRNCQPLPRDSNIVPYGIKVRTSQSDRSIRTQVPYKPIRSFHTDSSFVQANQIIPYGLKFRTSQSDRSIRTQVPYKPIRSFHTDSSSVQANQIARTVTGQNFRKDQVTRMITDRTSDETRSPSVKPPRHRTI